MIDKPARLTIVLFVWSDIKEQIVRRWHCLAWSAFWKKSFVCIHYSLYQQGDQIEKIDKNPTVFVNPAQPLMASVEVSSTRVKFFFWQSLSSMTFFLINSKPRLTTRRSSPRRRGWRRQGTAWPPPSKPCPETFQSFDIIDKNATSQPDLQYILYKSPTWNNKQIKNLNSMKYI